MIRGKLREKLRGKLREKLSKKKKGLSSFIYGLFFLAILLVLLFVSYRKVVLNDTLNMLNDDLTAASLSGLLPNEEYYSRPSKAGTQTANQLVISETDEAVDVPDNELADNKIRHRGYTMDQLLILWSERYNAGSKESATTGVYNTPFYKEDEAHGGEINYFSDFYNSLENKKKTARNLDRTKKDGTAYDPSKDKIFRRAIASVLDSFTSNVLNTDSLKYTSQSGNVSESVFYANFYKDSGSRKFNIIDNLNVLHSDDGIYKGIYKIDQSQLPQALKTVVTDGITITELNVYNVYKYDYADRHDYKSIFFNETNDTTIHNDGANGTIIFNAPDPKDSTKFEQVEAWNCQTTAVTGDINTWGDAEVASVVNSIISAPNVETVSPGINDTSFFNYYKAHFADSDTDTSKTSALNFEKRWMIDSLYYRMYLSNNKENNEVSTDKDKKYPLHFYTDTLKGCQDPNNSNEKIKQNSSEENPEQKYEYLYVDDYNALKIGEDVKSKSDVPIRDITIYHLTSSGMIPESFMIDNKAYDEKDIKATNSSSINIPEKVPASKTIHNTAIYMEIKFNVKLIAKAEYLGNADAQDRTIAITLPCVVELDQDDKA